MYAKETKKLLLVMKLTSLLLLTVLVQVSARSTAQTISLSMKQAPMEKVLAEIRKQSGYAFVYFNEDLAGAGKVDIQVKGVSLEEALKVSMAGQPLTYTIEDKVVVIKKARQPVDVDKPAAAVAPPVRIRVVDEEGTPLAGATVSVKRSKLAKGTNAEGVVELALKEGDVVEVSYTGFTSQKMTMGRNVNVVVRMIKATSKLDEVQVIAYGTTTQRYSVGNVSTVKGSDIVKAPVTNPLLAIQGRVPGIVLEAASGMPGTTISVRIQGVNSLGRGNNPLYVVDGIPYPSNALPNLNTGILPPSGEPRNGTDVAGEGTNAGSPLSFLDMNDIESIDILKDADATSIYGSRAANGAILITTKRGKAGAVKFGVNAQMGVGHVSRKLKVLNTEQYLAVRKEAYKNAGLPVPDASTPPDPSNYDLTYWDQKKNTNWQDVILGRAAKYTNIYASATGGSANTQFLIGSTYRRQTTVFPVDFYSQGVGMKVNVNTATTDGRFKFGVNADYFVNKSFLPWGDITNDAYGTPPNAPDLYTPDGTLSFGELPNGLETRRNPLATALRTTHTTTNNLIGSANLSYQIFKGLEAKATIGYNQMQSDGIQKWPLTSYNPSAQAYSPRGTILIPSNLNTWQAEPQLTYATTIGGGRLNVLTGLTFTETINKTQTIMGMGANSDLVLDNIQANPRIFISGVTYNQYKYAALFARVGYNWQDRYILSLNGRRDGSSRFGSANVLHSFGSVAGAWVFSNEAFLKDRSTFLSFGKLQASYGTTGNDNIGNYSHMSLYGIAGNGVERPFQGVTPIQPFNLSNPVLQWEEVRKLSAAINLGFLQDRILLNAVWYRNRCSNQLLSYQLPVTTGFGGIDMNFPATVQNSGWEFTLSTRNIVSRDFSWTTDFNLTVQRNKLLSFPGIENSSYKDVYVVGQPLNMERYYHYVGVDAQTGLYTFADVDGKVTSTPSMEARSVRLSAFPAFSGGMNNVLTYKNFRLDFLIQFVRQRGRSNRQGIAPGTMYNQPVFVLNRWRKPGDVAELQKYDVAYTGDPVLAYNYFEQSDAGYGDASYFKVNNMTFNWEVPAVYLKKLKLQQARIFTQAQNLFIITGYKGVDPEQRTGSLNMPSIRNITLGLQLTF